MVPFFTAVSNSGGHSRRGGHDAPKAKSMKTGFGLNKELDGDIFHLGERSSADLMGITQIVNHKCPVQWELIHS